MAKFRLETLSRVNVYIEGKAINVAELVTYIIEADTALDAKDIAVAELGVESVILITEI